MAPQRIYNLPIVFIASAQCKPNASPLGVHDNFDPQMLGITPRSLGIEVDTWEQAEVEYPNQAHTVRNYIPCTNIQLTQSMCIRVPTYMIKFRKSPKIAYPFGRDVKF